VTQLSQRQVTDLQRVWHDLRNEPDAAETPSTDDTVCRDWLDTWLAGVISGNGRLTSAALDDLLDLAREAKDQHRARAYVDRVVAAVMPTREEEPPWFTDLDESIREHCRQRSYDVSDGSRDRFGYWMWKIGVPNREEPVRLSLNGEVVLQTFPGGFTWPEFGYFPEETEEALQEQLRLLDSYADPATRTVLARRAMRRPRTELHLSDGTVLGCAEAGDRRHRTPAFLPSTKTRPCRRARGTHHYAAMQPSGSVAARTRLRQH
jgi:hypothetical protein